MNAKEQEENLAGKVIGLAGLVDYQAGAIVSRTVLNKKTGTVTLFAFDQGQALSEHTAPFDALVQDELSPGVAKDILASDFHKWKKGISKEDIEKQLEFYKERYGQ